MRWQWGVLVGLLCLSVPCAWADCTLVSVISSAAGTGGTLSDLSDRPARVCAVEFLANGANGFAQVFDSPDDTPGHAQATVVSEPGTAVAGEGDSRWYGEQGRPTYRGLDVLVQNGVAVVSWQAQ